MAITKDDLQVTVKVNSKGAVKDIKEVSKSFSGLDKAVDSSNTAMKAADTAIGKRRKLLKGFREEIVNLSQTNVDSISTLAAYQVAIGDMSDRLIEAEIKLANAGTAAEKLSSGMGIGSIRFKEFNAEVGDTALVLAGVDTLIKALNPSIDKFLGGIHNLSTNLAIATTAIDLIRVRNTALNTVLINTARALDKTSNAFDEVQVSMAALDKDSKKIIGSIGKISGILSKSQLVGPLIEGLISLNPLLAVAVDALINVGAEIDIAIQLIEEARRVSEDLTNEILNLISATADFIDHLEDFIQNVAEAVVEVLKFLQSFTLLEAALDPVVDIFEELQTVVDRLDFSNTSDSMRDYVEDVKDAREETDVLSSAIGVLNSALDGIAVAADVAGSAFKIVSDIGTAFRRTTQTINNFVNVIDTLSDPNKLRNLSALLNILSTIARFKGYGEAAKKLRDVSGQILGISEKIEDLKASGTSIQELGEKAIFLQDAFDTATDGVILLGGALGAKFLANNHAARFAFSKMTDVMLENSRAINANKMQLSLAARAMNETMKGNTRLANTYLLTGNVVGKTSATLASASKAFVLVKKDTLAMGKIVKNLAVPSLLKLAEAGTIVGPAMFTVGASMVQSESAAVKLGGALTIAAAIMIASFGAATVYLLKQLTKLADYIGTKLIEMISKFESRFRKTQAVMMQFAFTVEGLNRVFGDSVGTLVQWEQVLEDIKDGSTLAFTDIAKAIKLVTLEGQALGLNFAETSSLIKRSADVAASSGKSLTDTMQALLSALSGNSQAAFALGLDVREAALEHTEFMEASGKTVEQLNSQEKVMARLAAVFERTRPIIGAARNEMESIAGSGKILDRTLNDIGLKLGEQNTATVLYLTSLNKIAGAFLYLPDPILKATGSIADFLGVTLKIIGAIGVLTFKLLLPLSLFGALVTALNTTAAVQTALTVGFAKLGVVLGVQTVTVVSASTAWANFIVVTKAAAASLISNLGVALKVITAQILSSAAKIYAHPLFLKAAFIVGGIILVVKGLEKLNKETKIFTNMWKELSLLFKSAPQGVKTTNSALKDTGDILKTLGNIISNVGLMLVGGLLAQLEIFLNLALRLVRILPGVSDSLKSTLSKAIEASTSRFEKLSDAIRRAGRRLFRLEEEADSSRRGMGKYSKTLSAAAREAKQLEGRIEQVELAILRASEAGSRGAELKFGLDKLLLEMKLEKNPEALERLSKEVSRTEIQIQQFFNDSLSAARQGISSARLKALDDLGTPEALKKAADLAKELATSDLTQLQIQLEMFPDNTRAKQAIRTIQDEIVSINSVISKDYEDKISAAIKKASAAAKKELERLAKLEFAGGLSEKSLSNIEAARKGNQDIIDRMFLATASQREAIDYKLEKELEIIGRAKDLILLEGDIENKNNLARWRALTEKERLLQIEADILKQTLPATVGDAVKYIKEIIPEISKGFRVGIEAFSNMDLEGQFGSVITTFKTMTFNDVIAGLKEAGSAMWGIAKAGLTALSEIIKSITFEDIKNTIMTAAAYLVEAFTPTNINTLSNMIENISNLPGKLEGAFTRLGNVIGNTIANLPNVIDKMITALPKIFQKIAKALPELATVLVEGLAKFISSLPKLFDILAKKVPEILNSILKGLPAIIVEIAKALPKILDSIIAAIPDIVTALVENADEITKALVYGLMHSLPRMVVSIAKFVFVDLVKIVITKLPALLFNIVTGILQGLWEGFKDLGAWIFGDIGGAVVDTVSNVADSISSSVGGAANELFAVIEIGAAGRAMSTADKLRDAIMSATRASGSLLSMIWKEFVGWLDAKWKAILEGIKKVILDLWNVVKDIAAMIWKGLSAVGSWLDENVWQPVLGALNEAGVWLDENVWQPVLGALNEAATWLYDNIWLPILGALSEAGVWLDENVWQPILGALGEAATWLYDNIWGPIATVGLKILNGLKDEIANIGTNFYNLGKQIWDGLVDSIKSAGGAIAKALGFAEGGLVPNYLSEGGAVDNTIVKAGQGIKYMANGSFVPKGTDTVPAMLTPGEYVIPEPAASKIGRSDLESLRQGKIPSSGGSTVNYSFGNINITGQNIDERFVKNRMFPMIKEMLRRDSLDGKRILAPAGVR